MRKYVFQFVFLLAAMCMPPLAMAQGVIVAADVDTYVTLLGQECPIQHGHDWAVNAIELNGDTVHVELQTPSSLAGFLAPLTGEGDNVKRMWLQQLKSFGYPWLDLMDRLAQSQRTMVITFRPQGSRNTAMVVFTAADLATLASTEQPSPSGKPSQDPSGSDETHQAE